MEPTARLAGSGDRLAGSGGAPVSDAPPRRRSPRRWECHCRVPPTLLGMVEPSGRLNLKIRDRYYTIEGHCTIRAICPRCGRLHVLRGIWPPPVRTG
jgi:hypothetical protein